MPGVFDVLGHDHARVQSMLAELESCAATGSGPKRGNPSTKPRLARLLLAEVRRHEAAEEKVFWPAVLENLMEGKRFAEVAAEQRLEALAAIDRLSRLSAGNKRFRGILATSARVIRGHIAYEEGRVWPALRSALSEQQVRDLGREFEQARELSPIVPGWPGLSDPESGIHSDGMIALIDRLREAADGRPPK
jgi:hypothetical protein